jgi:hypothetical protein
VVKLLDSPFHASAEYQSDPLRSFSTLSIDVAPRIALETVSGLFLYTHRTRICEVFLGARNPLASQREIDSASSDLSLVERARELGWSLQAVSTSARSWDLSSNGVQYDHLAVVRCNEDGPLASFDGEAARLLLSKLDATSIQDSENFELTRWQGALYFKRNGEFV